jgi:hypothetical protein
MATIPDPPHSRRAALRLLAAAPLAPALAPRASLSAPPSPRDVLPMGQPDPLDTLVAHYHTGVRTITAITRQWADGAPARCRLCQRPCVARAGVCLIVVGSHVSQEAAPHFSTHGLVYQGDAARVRLMAEGGAP